MSLLKNISSSAGFTKKAVADVARAITIIHAIARNSLNQLSFISASSRLCLSLVISDNKVFFII